MRILSLKRVINRARLVAMSGFLDFNVGAIDTSSTNKLPQNFAERVLSLLTTAAYPLAFIAIVYSAYALITSMGNPDAYAKAKKNVIYLTTGIFLIIFAGVLYRFARSLFSAL